jgi:hypothetical protein
MTLNFLYYDYEREREREREKVKVKKGQVHFRSFASDKRNESESGAFSGHFKTKHWKRLKKQLRRPKINEI